MAVSTYFLYRGRLPLLQGPSAIRFINHAAFRVENYTIAFFKRQRPGKMPLLLRRWLVVLLLLRLWLWLLLLVVVLRRRW